MTASAFEVEVVGGIYRVSLNGLILEVSGVVRDREVIRAVIAVLLPDGTLKHRDRVNLTSARTRGRFVDALQEATASVLGDGLAAKALLALEEAVRRRPPAARPRVDDARPDSSGTPPATVEDLEARVGGRLLLADRDAVRVLLGTVAAHRRLKGDPVWLMLVGPPSGAKTELVTMLARTPGVFLLSELTSRTFASGLTTGGEEPSLLARLKDEILLFKDFTTVLQMRRDERQAVLAQLREIYDGRYDKVWGTGKEFHWEGRLGFVAGVTPVIDSHHSVMAVLGQRFVFLRLRQPDRRAVAKRAMANSRRDREGRHELAAAVAAFVTGLADRDPAVGEVHETTIAELADFVTRARSAVERDGWRRELEYAPEPEGPARLAKQFFALARGLALVANRQEVTDEDIGRLVRVGLDCIPAARRVALEALAKGDEDLTTTALANQLQFSTTTIRRALEDLQSLGMAACAKSGRGKQDTWSLGDGWREPMRLFTEMASAREPEWLQDGIDSSMPEPGADDDPGETEP